MKCSSPWSRLGWKEGHNFTTDGIHAREIRALAEIAAVAGQGEVVKVVVPAMLPGNDVLDVVC